MSAVATPAAPGPLGQLRAWRQRRRVHREARLVVAEVRRGIRRGSGLGDGLKLELERDAAALAAALERAKGKPKSETAGGGPYREGAGEPDAEAEIRDGLRALDEKADRHLSYARKSTVREYAESIGIAVMFALFLRAFVVEAFKIPSGSMIPTLEVGDHIFVNKYIYGIRIPWTTKKFFEWRTPHRGEVIVFMYPENTDQDFIKRVVAVEGDKLEVRNNQLIINGVPQSRKMVDDQTCAYNDWDKENSVWLRDIPCILYQETLDGHVFYTMDSPHPRDTAKRNCGHVGPDANEKCGKVDVDKGDGLKADGVDAPHNYVDAATAVPPGFVFVMGDNRDDSHDSRYWGFVPMDNIKGEALIVWWSLGWKYHWDRIGKMIY